MRPKPAFAKRTALLQSLQPDTMYDEKNKEQQDMLNLAWAEMKREHAARVATWETEFPEEVLALAAKEAAAKEAKKLKAAEAAQFEAKRPKLVEESEEDEAPKMSADEVRAMKFTRGTAMEFIGFMAHALETAPPERMTRRLANVAGALQIVMEYGLEKMREEEEG